jgi:hypothetical protein
MNQVATQDKRRLAQEVEGRFFFFFRGLRALKAGGLVAACFLIPFTFISLAKPSATPSLSKYIGPICATVLQSSPTEEASFISENVDAMKKMMANMDIKPTGDVDRDFAAIMVPHHQGAIEMARAELRYGHNEQLKRMAQEIIVTQLQEIAAMHLVLGQPLAVGRGDRTVAGDASVQHGDFK